MFRHLLQCIRIKRNAALSLDDFHEIAPNNEECTGYKTAQKEYFIMSANGGLMSFNDEKVLYLNPTPDVIWRDCKTGDLLFVEISEFCKWANAEYKYDSNTDTYFFNDIR